MRSGAPVEAIDVRREHGGAELVLADATASLLGDVIDALRTIVDLTDAAVVMAYWLRLTIGEQFLSRTAAAKRAGELTRVKPSTVRAAYSKYMKEVVEPWRAIYGQETPDGSLPPPLPGGMNQEERFHFAKHPRRRLQHEPARRGGAAAGSSKASC